MNEATLEARVNAEIKKYFPKIARLKITHQKYLNLKVGHHTDIKTGGIEQAKVTGRLDVLLSYENQNLAILELKNPELKITDEDRDQGLSYAKLLTPQAPLVIVSNGKDVAFYQTYDGKNWESQTKDEEAIQTLFSHALSNAATEREEAIRLLMGAQPIVWKSLFQKYTEATLNQLVGKIDQFTKPICQDFIVKRSVVSKILKNIFDGEILLALIGPPLSGKTNVLSQLCMDAGLENYIPIYIDAQNTSYGIFQHLANQFTRELYIPIQLSEIRQWIFHSLQSISSHLIIVIDNWTSDISGTLKEDIDELINFLTPSFPLTILLCMDDTTYQDTKNIPGRPTYSAIGGNAKPISLSPLNDDEFKSVCELLYNNFLAGFNNGAHLNLDFRIPRFLRLITSMINQPNSDPILRKDKKQIKVIPSITSFLIFGSWSRYISHNETEGFFQDLARTYLLDKQNRINEPKLCIMSHGKGHIIRETAEKNIGFEKLKSMQTQGHIGTVKGPNGKILILPKVPEFLAMAGSYVISEECMSIYENDNFDDAYVFLVNESDSFPYGDLVGAKAILDISNKNWDLANDIINKLLKDEPTEDRLSEGSRALAYFEDVGNINIEFGEGTNETVTGNIQPWNILSQICSYLIRSGKNSVDSQLMILATVGTYHRTLLRPQSSSIEQNLGFHEHDIGDHGSVLCHQSGIIEPITFAMQCGFYEIPKDMLRLCLFAKENDLFFLAHRLNMAAASVLSCIEKNVVKAASEAQEILRNTISSTKKSVKVGRNDPCPCGSNKKYKKCCGK